MKDDNNPIMPPAVTLTFLYTDHPICSIPVSVLVLLVRDEGITDENQHLNVLELAPDQLADGESSLMAESCLAFLQETIPWKKLADYLSYPDYLSDGIKSIWSARATERGFLSIRFRRTALPDTVYRYMPFTRERASQLLAEGNLFLPSPAVFNNPFDCSLDEATRLTYIESAIGCFSTVPDSVLMSSQYADGHKGITVGFDTKRLITSLSKLNKPLRAEIRPVWYLPAMPKLNLSKKPALYATCKSDVWRHEQEFRIFLMKDAALAASGAFPFDRESITEVICGCKAPDDTVAACKMLTDSLPACKRKKAVQLPGRFGIQLQEIPRA
jgi:hypothetical protein